MIDLKASPNNLIFSSDFLRHSQCHRTDKCSELGLLYHNFSSKEVKSFGRSNEKRRKFGNGQIRVVPSCSSSTSSAGSELELAGKEGEGKVETVEGQFGCLVSEFGWRVRRLIRDEDEMRNVAQVQAEAFHVPAEVLSGLMYKLRNSPPDRYACLVAEPKDASESSNDRKGRLVGVVDVTVLRDEMVLSHLEGTEEYLYVSGIAVLGEFRRQKVATVLLKACDLLSILWGFDYLVLRAYEDDAAALRLYTNAGYRVVSGDPPWMTTWIGRKRRVLMIKYSSLST
ncbi:hypothetical protein IFM89_009913 [Coptis chinensis]|uniref:N-acetyltransferase domain-containing protein n=1 Tax=Coptis chinensis TaxID=261450 RepID=A0A835I2M3_9MAGN|nr:hypothetical protein IFM89_009913 [Coptis chinensis]